MRPSEGQTNTGARPKTALRCFLTITVPIDRLLTIQRNCAILTVAKKAREGTDRMGESGFLGRNISVAYRQANRFYDRVLAPYQIACGQQFFLLRIYEHEGISMYDLARLGQFDKGTVTRAVQKLEELGYVRAETDAQDKRVRRLYTTPEAEEAVRTACAAREQLNMLLTRGMTPEEVEMARRLLERIAENAMTSLEQEGMKA